MSITENTKYIIATIGVLLLGAGYGSYTFSDEIMSYFSPQAPKEVHVHAGFLFYVLGEKVDLSAERYQSSVESVKHPTMHFHDGIDTMLHRHAEGVTLGEFFNAIGITLTNNSVTLDTGARYQNDGTNELRMFVNKERVTDPEKYIIQEEDQILLYYGDPNAEEITSLIDEVSDEACIYSGTCPERGEPPFETCGITCEVTQQ